MADKLQEGDTIAIQGEVSAIHDDGRVTVRLVGFDYPITTRGEHLSLVTKKLGTKRKAKNDDLL